MTPTSAAATRIQLVTATRYILGFIVPAGVNWEPLGSSRCTVWINNSVESSSQLFNVEHHSNLQRLTETNLWSTSIVPMRDAAAESSLFPDTEMLSTSCFVEDWKVLSWWQSFLFPLLETTQEKSFSRLLNSPWRAGLCDSQKEWLQDRSIKSK